MNAYLVDFDIEERRFGDTVLVSAAIYLSDPDLPRPRGFPIKRVSPEGIPCHRIRDLAYAPYLEWVHPPGLLARWCGDTLEQRVAAARERVGRTVAGVTAMDTAAYYAAAAAAAARKEGK